MACRCLFVRRLNPIYVKTADPIGPNFFVEPDMTPDMVIDDQNVKNFPPSKFDFHETLKIQEQIIQTFFVIVLYFKQRENAHNGSTLKP